MLTSCGRGRVMNKLFRPVRSFTCGLLCMLCAYALNLASHDSSTCSTPGHRQFHFGEQGSAREMLCTYSAFVHSVPHKLTSTARLYCRTEWAWWPVSKSLPSARRVLSSVGMAVSHLPPLEKRAEDMTLQRGEEQGQTEHAMWADNMFSRHFLANPMRSNVSAHLSLIMVVPTRRRLRVFTGHKHIADVRTSVNSIAILVQESFTNLLKGIRFTLRNIKRDSVSRLFGQLLNL